MTSFAARGLAREGGFFKQEERALVHKRLKAMVAAGNLPDSVVKAFEAAASAPSMEYGIPTELRTRPIFESAYQHIHDKWRPGNTPTLCCPAHLLTCTTWHLFKDFRFLIIINSQIPLIYFYVCGFA